MTEEGHPEFSDFNSQFASNHGPEGEALALLGDIAEARLHPYNSLMRGAGLYVVTMRMG